MTFQEMNSQLLSCRKCPRLVEWREKVSSVKRRAYTDCEYWGKPVPGFGDSKAHIFVVGLAPGAHGSNRTGRQFTGDASGEFLFPALYRAGFASKPQSVSRADGLILTDLYTAPVCRCAPPKNKPTPLEMDNCQPYLEEEIRMIQPRVIVALGRIAFDRIIKMYSPADKGANSFAHNSFQQLPGGRFLLCSYHPSRQNTQTGRLTEEMIDEIWITARDLAKRMNRPNSSS